MSSSLSIFCSSLPQLKNRLKRPIHQFALNFKLNPAFYTLFMCFTHILLIDLGIAGGILLEDQKSELPARFFKKELKLCPSTGMG